MKCNATPIDKRKNTKNQRTKNNGHKGKKKQ